MHFTRFSFEIPLFIRDKNSAYMKVVSKMMVLNLFHSSGSDVLLNCKCELCAQAIRNWTFATLKEYKTDSRNFIHKMWQSIEKKRGFSRIFNSVKWKIKMLNLRISKYMNRIHTIRKVKYVPFLYLVFWKTIFHICFSCISGLFLFITAYIYLAMQPDSHEKKRK